METPPQSRIPFGDQPITLMQARPWLPRAIKNRSDRREPLVVHDKSVDLIPHLFRQPVPQRILHNHIQAKKPVGYRLRLLDDGAVINRDHAIRLIEELLHAEEREFARRGQPITLAIARVTEHRLGWIIGSQSEAYLRSGNTRDMLVGAGPYLVDRHDGSIHQIPAPDYRTGGWEEDYEQRIKPTPSAEAAPLRDVPFATELREALADHGRVTAIRVLRQNAPRLTMAQASAYVAAIEKDERPPTELIELARPPERFSPRLGITTIAGPIPSSVQPAEHPAPPKAQGNPERPD
jgi:hypothetical protein